MLISNLIMVITVVFCAIMLLAYKFKYSRILSQKKSSEVRLGQIAEHLSPFLDQFNHDPKQARFIGTPLDFVVFEDDGIYFVEVKTGNSRLSTGQNKYKKLINEGKVFFEEITIRPDGIKSTSSYKRDPKDGKFKTITANK